MTVCNFEGKKCVPCEGGVPAVEKEMAEKYVQEIAGWELSDDAKEIKRVFKFKNYYKTMAFVNAVAWMANGENHHPDMEVSYNTCVVRYTTHAIDGLSENDFICANKVNHLLEFGPK